MKIYNYSNNTGEFISESNAIIDPLEFINNANAKEPVADVYLIPACATELKPPTTTENKIAVFDGEIWEIKEDFRGQEVYNKETLAEKTISEIGEIAEEFTKIAPANNYQIYDNETNSWIIDDSKRAELIKIIGEKIDTETEHDIIYTFIFNNVAIRLNRDDQFNFSQDVLIKDTHDYPHTIKSLNGFYELISADEYQNMYNAGLQHKNALLRNGWTKKAELATLTTSQLIEKLG